MKGAKPKSGAIRRGQSDSFGMSTPGRVGVEMPQEIADNPVQRKIWNWICPPTNNFTQQDIPSLMALCFWHATFLQAKESITSPSGDGTIAIYDKIGEKPFPGKDGKPLPLVKKHPAITIMKEASSEIRALSDQLGLSPLARSRIGLMDATTVKTAADTAAMFRSIDAAYQIDGPGEPLELEAEYEAD